MLNMCLSYIGQAADKRRYAPSVCLRRYAPSVGGGATRRMTAAAQRAECYNLRGSTKMVIQSTCKPATEYTPSGATRRLSTSGKWEAVQPPPLRGGCACAAAPRPTAASKEPLYSRGASRRRSVGRRAPPLAAKRLTFVAASASFPPLLRAAASVRHIACGAGARHAATQATPPRIGGYKCKLTFTFITCGGYKCNLPQASRTQAADYQPSGVPLVKYYEGKSVRCAPNPLTDSRLHT